MRYVLFMRINSHFPQFISGLQNSVLVMNQSKDALYSGRSDLQLPNLTLIRSKSINSPLIERCPFHCQKTGTNDKLGLSICPLHSEENSLGYEDKCSSSQHIVKR